MIIICSDKTEMEKRSKQIRMRPRIKHQKSKLGVVLLTNEQPIGLNMAFPSVVAFEA
jgi:hypothetical protein